MSRAVTILALVAIGVVGCARPGTPSALDTPAAATDAPDIASPSPGSPASTAPGASLDATTVPGGRIAYMRVDADKVERYFTVDPLGTNELALFETRGCACIRWSPDGTQLWTVTETETGLRYTTMDPDGGNVQVHVPDIQTLNLAPGFGSADGQHVGFFGWDDTDASRTGVWVARSNLEDLRQVSASPEGVLGIDPVGMSADGSHLYFHGDLGPNDDNDFHHAGNVYVVATDGTGLRQLNPEGTLTEVTGEGLSADGGRLAFTAWQAGSGDEGNALFVVDGPGGDVERVTDWTVGLWGASWAPTGDWIALIQAFGDVRVPSLVRPDGRGLRAISAIESSEPAFGPAWSPDGTHFLVRRGSQHANDLWIMDLEGTFVWQVTNRPASYDIYAWAPPVDR